MRPRPDHLDPLILKKAQLTHANQVRYRVYQSASEYIVVVAESALMALRIAGVKNPYKILRDIPAAGAAVEKGEVQLPESGEMVPLPVAHKAEQSLKFEQLQEHEGEPFVGMELQDIHKRRLASANILTPQEGMDHFVDMPANAPTLSAPMAAPQSQKPMVAAPAAPPEISVAPPEPQPKQDDGVLSQDDIAKLLGDV